MRALVLAALSACLVSAPALADGVTATIASIEPHRVTVTMTDRTVWELGAAAPEWLAPGQRVHIAYRMAGEDGLVGIDAVTLIAPAPAPVAGRS